MRLLYASRSWGGHDRRFHEAWSANGVSVATVTVDGSGPGEAGGSIVDFAARARRVIADHRPQVAQAGPLTDVAPALQAVWDGPLIAMSWGFDLMNEISDPSVRTSVEEVLGSADLVVVDNDAPASVALGLGLAPGKLVQFPWGVDVDFFARPADRPRRDPSSSPTSDLTVFSPRRHEHIYGVDTVIGGFIAASERAPRLRLVLAGSGSLTQTFRDSIDAAGLTARVEFVGELAPPQLRDQLFAVDVYVTASHVDGTSVSLLEAMAAGTPVVASRIPGNRQWVTAATGFTFADGEAPDLADVLVGHAVGDSQAWADIHARADVARRIVAEQGDWRRTARRLPNLARDAVRRWEAAQ